MTYHKTRMLIGLVALLVFCSAFSFYIPAQAQTTSPTLVITWKTNSLVPATFKGKALPTTGSSIGASVILLQNGKVVSLGSEVINWYVNNKQIGSGVGVTSASFEVPGIAPNTIDLRAELPFYGSTDLVVETIEIPVVPPQVVIDAPFPNQSFQESKVTVYARPFFFNVPQLSSLSLKWFANNKEVNTFETPELLTISIEGNTNIGAKIPVRLEARNPLRFADTASHALTLYFGGQ